MKTIETKVLVIGGGPGGYVAAIRCGQLGLKTTLVEGERVGGACLIRGCIPSKAMIHTAALFDAMSRSSEAPMHGISLPEPPSFDMQGWTGWKDGIVDRLNGGVGSLLKRAGVNVVSGWAKFSDARTCKVDSGDEAVEIRAEHVILATGSIPVELSNLPFGANIISSTEALSLNELPERVVIVGAGYIGLEIGTALQKLGSDVSIVEMQDDILPSYDKDLVAPVRKWLEDNDVALHLGAKALGLSENGASLRIETREGDEVKLPADKVLAAAGRKPATDGWGLEEMAIEMDGPFIKIDSRCATSTRNVWAIGDVTGEPMLAHRASAQGEMVAEIIASEKRVFNPMAIPAVCFTDPEIVSVGMTPDEAGDEIVTGIFPLRASGRAMTLDAADSGGFVRVLSRKDDRRIVGVQAVGAEISELAAAFTQAIEMGSVLEDIAGTIYAHPTLGEAFHEAALKSLGHAIHA
ncbi:dihydrolipoyl dehydrogenase [Notoacmeibacter sp. MSK16QG-6]|uniref:dihydrolipoyl dehydrogenase n=1 Tax=Notoacmeibacter sp. MSK16QG-6 TaxID=2957982 RepID=UPI00209D5DDA|nr:dihydrolipoyl dehydrogenase [Notoacmeibacter sp. MSK16QG-6]MCP1200796.1 dihydrolipoyl dehydrogenase [Notoacmeibacter sp. MSK16QG-6]